MKRIIVACGSGVVTSKVVADKVSRLLSQNGIEAQVLPIDIADVESYIEGSVAYVAITKVRKEYPLLVVNGITFLTGVGQDAELRKLIEVCR
ncbi:MAG: PTS sugar transporter subunit IIB [Anaerostipes sp.]|jgi:PTS system galactitol-specific IIB component|nr:PTS sugar transporter subunit IIB [Anaerostipes sp.]